MSYIEPASVLSPRNRIRSVDVIYNSSPGQGGWSVAVLDYDGEERVGIRWNGEQDEPGMGNPQSRAKPTWFVVPCELGNLVREEAERLSDSQEGGLLAGYRQMANDREQEAEAREWCEGLIGDAANQER